MALPGMSTLGIRFLYGVETTAGQKPASFTELTRINGIGGITIDVETIDASALIDKVTRSVAGRGDTGGDFTVTVNITPDTITEWQTLISAYKTAKEAGKQTWFEVYHPDLTSGAFFIVAEPPQEIPMPESGQNELWTVEFTLTINEYKGLDTAVVPQNLSDDDGQ